MLRELKLLSLLVVLAACGCIAGSGSAGAFFTHHSGRGKQMR